jgi:hypothetical protein
VLLFEDARDPTGDDKTWIQTHALGRFLARSPRAQRALVPGTALAELAREAEAFRVEDAGLKAEQRQRQEEAGAR